MFNSARPSPATRPTRPAPPRYRLAAVLMLILAFVVVGRGLIGSRGVGWAAAPAVGQATVSAPAYPLYAWGDNYYGQLGTGTPPSSATPLPVKLPAGVTPLAIAAGTDHNLALGSDNKLYAWGYNAQGQLGNGTATDSATPVTTSLPASVTPTQLAAGGQHNLAIGTNGKLYAWGANNYGQLGIGTTISKSIAVTVSLPGGVTPTAIAAGSGHSLAIGNNGKLYAWGFNGDGELGIGTTPYYSSTPLTVSLPAGVTPLAVAAGYEHNLAIGSDGKLYAWGANNYGQLGNGNTTSSSTPLTVSLPAGVTPTAIAVGYGHSLAIGSDGKLYAWGFNYYGQLGNGAISANNPNPTPVVVKLPAGVNPTQLAAGYFHSLTLGSDNKLYAWGLNSSGELGNGTRTDSSTPVIVGSVAGVANLLLAGGANHSLAVLALPGQIAATGGSNQNATVGTSFAAPLVASVRDNANNPVSNATVIFTAPAGGDGGTFSGGSPVYTGTTDASGTVTATTFTANTIAGSYSVKATVSGVITPATFTLTNTADVAANVTASIGDGQSTAITTFFANPLVVSVTDQYNNPVSGTLVTFNPPSTGPSATFYQRTTISGASGQATSSPYFANNVAGSYSVTASVSGVITPASFTLTNLPGPASALVLVSGDNQQAVISTTFASPLVAKVTDREGNAVSGAEVDFAAPASGPSANFAGSSVYTATTDATGLLTTTNPAANSIAGSYTVTATLALPGQPARRAGIVGPRTTAVQYHLTNLAGCNPLVVTSTGDDGSCGTLRAALIAASSGPTKTVSIQLTAGSTITLTTGLTLTSGVAITTTAPCGSGAGNTMLPPVTIQSQGTSSGNGLTLVGHNRLYGLWVRGFSGVQIKAPMGSATLMQCVKASKS